MKNGRLVVMPEDSKYIIRCNHRLLYRGHYLGANTRQEAKKLSEKIRRIDSKFVTHITRVTRWPEPPRKWYNLLPMEFAQWMGNQNQ